MTSPRTEGMIPMMPLLDIIQISNSTVWKPIKDKVKLSFHTHNEKSSLKNVSNRYRVFHVRMRKE